MRAMLSGKGYFYHLELHKTYGDVVRTAPNALSFAIYEPAKDIYTDKPGRGQLRKDPAIYTGRPDGSYSILSMPSDVDYSRVRGLLNPAFWDKAM